MPKQDTAAPEEHNHEANVSTTACPACMDEGQDFVQRGNRGFSDNDAWGFDTYLAGVIAAGVRHLAANLHGCPPQLVEGGADDAVDVACQKWASILAEIAQGFEAYAEEKFTNGGMSPKFERSFDLFRHWFPDLWD